MNDPDKLVNLSVISMWTATVLSEEYVDIVRQGSDIIIVPSTYSNITVLNAYK